jgi:hypothetical protein
MAHAPPAARCFFALSRVFAKMQPEILATAEGEVMQSMLFATATWPWLLLAALLGLAFGRFFCREH